MANDSLVTELQVRDLANATSGHINGLKINEAEGFAADAITAAQTATAAETSAAQSAQAAAGHAGVFTAPTKGVLDNIMGGDVEGLVGLVRNGLSPVPITPFEATGVLTSWEDETTFWESLTAKSSRVSVEDVGSTVGGRPVRMVSVGYPAAPPATETLDGESLLVIAYQHGAEVSPREAAMQFARDLAFTDDPETRRYLQSHPVRILPCVNADRVGVWAPNDNLNDINLNRDHLAAAQPEGKAMRNALRIVRPHMVVDLHESTTLSDDLQITTGEYPGTHFAVVQVMNEMHLAMVEKVRAGGHTAGVYAGSSQVPTTARTAVSKGLCPAVTVEAQSTGRTIKNRVRVHAVGLSALVGYHMTHVGLVRAAVKALRSGPPAVAYLKSSLTLDPAPVGYRMTATQYAAVSPTLAIQGLQTVQDGTDHLITLDQVNGWIVPDMIDPEALFPVGVGARHYTAIPAYVVPDNRSAWRPEPRQYSHVFGTDDVGEAPSGVSLMMGTGCTIAEIEGGTNGRALDLVPGVLTAYAFPESLTDPNINDFDLLLRWKAPYNTNQHGPSIFGRVTDGVSGYNGYRAGYRHVGSPPPATGSAHIARYTNGSLFTLDPRPRTTVYIPGSWNLMRFRMEGNLLSMKMWPASQSEPALWDNSVFDDAWSTGWVGFGMQGAGVRMYLDWVSLATGGASAPVL